MNHFLARMLSIAGHPAVLMVVAAVAASPRSHGLFSVAVTVACGIAVLAYSFLKTRRGDWGHIDASAPIERAQLNTRVGWGLLLAAGVLFLAGVHAGIAIVVGLSGLIVMAGHLLRRLAKPSLHVAFAVFAVFVAWPAHVAAMALLAMAVAVGWSRLVLRRHVGRDVFWGATLGTAAGALFQAVRSSLI